MFGPDCLGPPPVCRRAAGGVRLEEPRSAPADLLTEPRKRGASRRTTMPVRSSFIQTCRNDLFKGATWQRLPRFAPRRSYPRIQEHSSRRARMFVTLSRSRSALADINIVIRHLVSAGSLYTLFTRGLFHCSPRSRAVGDPRVSSFEASPRGVSSLVSKARARPWGQGAAGDRRGKIPAIFLGRPGQGLRMSLRALSPGQNLPHGDAA
jgi:hypothetical protein